MLLTLILFLLACVAMMFSGAWLVTHLTRIAAYLRVSGFVAAFVIMALSTSLPELFVGISAATSNNGALALGNIIGSNIVVLTLIVGISVLLARGIKVPSKTVRRESLSVFVIVVILSLLMFIGNGLSRFDGGLLVLLFLYHLYTMYKGSKRFSQKFADKPPRNDFVISVVIFIVSLVVLFGSADAVVKYGTSLASDLSLPPILIGLFIVALGTSLPELAFQVRAATQGKGEMSLGDALGSVITNSTLIIGIVALINPIEANFLLYLTSAIFMVVITFIFLTFVESEDRLRVKEGISLIFLYVIFLVVEFYIKTIEGKELF
ncbi:sodium:calcium antiporter [Patescibacteria group bacterium]|nr:sodium:calcium antiporter [Patescibacteria group bacterium]